MSKRRAALVTGAASGIGRAITERLVADGYDVLAVDVEPDAEGPGVPHRADLTDAVAGVVAFLAGPEGRAFTGVPVTMDLGWTAG